MKEKDILMGDASSSINQFFANVYLTTIGMVRFLFLLFSAHVGVLIGRERVSFNVFASSLEGLRIASSSMLVIPASLTANIMHLISCRVRTEPLDAIVFSSKSLGSACGACDFRVALPFAGLDYSSARDIENVLCCCEPVRLSDEIVHARACTIFHPFRTHS